MATVVLTFPQPDKVISANELLTRSPHAARVVGWRRATWKAAARHAAEAHAGDLAAVAGRPVEVTVSFPRPTGRRMDTDNLSATVKPVLDGITLSGAVWPDDSPSWVRPMPAEQRTDPGGPCTVTISLLP